MPFKSSVTQLTTKTKNHADVFNALMFCDGFNNGINICTDGTIECTRINSMGMGYANYLYCGLKKG